MNDDLILTEPAEIYAEEIRNYRQEFIDNGDHMDGCGALRTFENPFEYIDNCQKRMQEDAAKEVGGRAHHFLCIREEDNHLIGMMQYRYGADPKFQIGYSVRPSDRGNGYAKWMLQKLLEWLRKQGKTDITIACEPSNVASEHVILSCGGKLHETCNYKGIDLNVYRMT